MKKKKHKIDNIFESFPRCYYDSIVQCIVQHIPIHCKTIRVGASIFMIYLSSHSHSFFYHFPWFKIVTFTLKWDNLMSSSRWKFQFIFSFTVLKMIAIKKEVCHVVGSGQERALHCQKGQQGLTAFPNFCSYIFSKE